VRETRRRGAAFHAGGESRAVLRPQAARPAAMHHAWTMTPDSLLARRAIAFLCRMLRRIVLVCARVIRLARHHFELRKLSMSGQDIPLPDEIDALMRGVQQGAVAETPPETPPDTGEARATISVEAARLVRGRMPALEMINDRFARLLRTPYTTFCADGGRLAGPLQFVKFSDHVNRLKLPTSLNLCQFRPLVALA